MPSSAASEWREKAGGFFSSSSFKIKQATQTAGLVVGDVAKNAGSSMAEAAERAGSAVRARWSLLQQQQQQRQQNQVQDGPTVQERFRSASLLLRKNLLETKELVAVGLQDTKEKVAVGLLDTKEKVVVGKAKVEEVAKRAAQRSKLILADWRQKGHAGKVFGVPLEVLVQRQKSPRPIPLIVVKCVDFLILSGLNAEYIFKKDGDHRAISRLIAMFDEDSNASLQGASPADVAALLKVFLHMLPEPLLMFDLYDAIVSARGSLVRLREVIITLHPANYHTLEYLSALLLRISQKSTINKMDSHSLAFELAPALLWQRGKSKSPIGKSRAIAAGSFRSSRLTPVIERPKEEAAAVSEDGNISASQPRRVSVLVNVEDTGVEWHNLEGSEGSEALKVQTVEERNGDLSAQIPLDDDDDPVSVDFAIVEAVQCLIDQHNVVFTDSIEAVWQDLDS